MSSKAAALAGDAGVQTSPEFSLLEAVLSTGGKQDIQNCSHCPATASKAQL